MPRDLRGNERQKRAQARREHALLRVDLREPSTPRRSADSPTSHPVKVMDPSDRCAIDEFLAKRKVDNA